MNLIVLKFGGTSLANCDLIKNAALIIKKEIIENKNKVCVVVSAMAGTTNNLVNFCSDFKNSYKDLEKDSVLATGEQITCGLMTLALKEIGLESISYQGWQIPILTDNNPGKARIIGINPEKLKINIKENIIPVITGFQGVNEHGRITTLGRGGSDTTALALAAVLNADRCDIYTDVEGVFSCDPRIVDKAQKINRISYEEMLESSSLGAKVLEPRSSEIAMKYNVCLRILSSFSKKSSQGTIVCSEDEILEKTVVNCITCSNNDAKISIFGIKDIALKSADIFELMASHQINVDMIIQNDLSDITFTLSKENLFEALTLLQNAQDNIKYKNLKGDADISKISIIGIGMRSNVGIAATLFKTLGKNNIPILGVATSEIKISCLIPENSSKAAIKALHTAYNLDKN